MEAKLGISLYSYPYLSQQKPLVLLINVYTLSSTKLEIRAKQYLLGSKGVGGKGGCSGKEAVLTQSLYAHMNKGNLKKVSQPLEL
jgi:hypothetical protein